MGLTWCPRDPKISVDDEILDCYCLIPIQYQNKFDSFNFTIYVRPRAKTDVLYTEEGVNVEFVEERGRKKGDVRVQCSVKGIPSNAHVLLRVFAPWDGQFEFTEGTAESVSISFNL